MSENKTIKDFVIEKIKSGQAKMKPKWHFVLKAVLFILGIILITLTILYLISFIIFSLNQTGAIFAPSFGLRGFGIFMASLPWVLILVSGIFIIILEILVKHYSFAYKKPIFYSVLGILILVLAGGFIISRSGFHQKFFRDARNFKLPLAGPLYREFGMKKFDDIHIGTIVKINEKSFVLENNRGEMLSVNILSNTRLSVDLDLKEGDLVMVVGRRNGDIVDAFGIRKADDQMMMFERGAIMNRPPAPLE
ncbi:MAG: hypothetical protein WC705_03540 [Candidatus Paceibacterota bacterium]|jgi:hypothetical protein